MEVNLNPIARNYSADKYNITAIREHYTAPNSDTNFLSPDTANLVYGIVSFVAALVPIIPYIIWYKDLNGVVVRKVYYRPWRTRYKYNRKGEVYSQNYRWAKKGEGGGEKKKWKLVKKENVPDDRYIAPYDRKLKAESPHLNLPKQNNPKQISSADVSTTEAAAGTNSTVAYEYKDTDINESKEDTTQAEVVSDDPTIGTVDPPASEDEDAVPLDVQSPWFYQLRKYHFYGLQIGAPAAFLFWWPVAMSWSINMIFKTPFTMTIYRYCQYFAFIDAAGINFFAIVYHFMKAARKGTLHTGRHLIFLALWISYAILMLIFEFFFYPGAAQYVEDYFNTVVYERRKWIREREVLFDLHKKNHADKQQEGEDWNMNEEDEAPIYVPDIVKPPKEVVPVAEKSEEEEETQEEESESETTEEAVLPERPTKVEETDHNVDDPFFGDDHEPYTSEDGLHHDGGAHADPIKADTSGMDWNNFQRAGLDF